MSSDYKHRRIGGRQGKMRLAHHILWEEASGPIPEGYEIHHIDENKKNNDLENLKLLSVSDHQRTHSPHYAILDGKWVRICPDCRQIGADRRHPVCDDCRAKKERIRRRNAKMCRLIGENP